MSYTLGRGLECAECLDSGTAISDDTNSFACNVYTEVIIPSMRDWPFEFVKSRDFGPDWGRLSS